jgi:DHA1 family bicyclomycin/chloramphenicol resistance-like MFS transporter
MATSLLCAMAPNIWMLLGFRLVQGAAGAAGIVIARAIVRDLHTGVAAARFFALLMLVNGLAPILAPLVGGELLHVTDWRGIFVVLAAIGAALLLAAWAMLAETLAPEARHGGGLTATLRACASGRWPPTSAARPSSCRTSTARPRRSSACCSRSTPAGSSPPARSAAR